MRNEVLIDVAGVSQRYGAKEVLADVNLQIHNLHVDGRTSGQVVAIVGPSGSGKTQLMRIIAGLQKPTTGTVTINGVPVRKGMCGFVFQRYPLFGHRTVMSNLELSGRLAGLSATDAKQKATEYLEMFRLLDSSGKYPAELSGGMQQRVAIARQMIGLDGHVDGIRVLMLDEPFSALDYANTRKTATMLRNVADLHDTNTLFVTTHDLRTGLALADFVVLMGFREKGGPGRIVRTWDLVTEGLTWQPEVEEMPRFREILKELRTEICV